MNTTAVDPVVAANLEEIGELLAAARRGVRDPEAMRKASDEMDRMREELRQKIGTVDAAVALIRAGRDE